MTGNHSHNDPAGAVDLQHRWNQRAAETGTSLQGVLYRGFSEQLNEYIHDWHVRAVTTQLLPRLPAHALVLDLGCGYGRIRRHVAHVRPDLRLVGVDFSESYCKLHAKTFAADTVCADMRYLPFDHGIFDGIIGVTCLMYLESTERKKSIQQILAKLKPAGHALFIDPGLEFMRLARAGLRSTRETPTGGMGFRMSEYSNLSGTQGLTTLAIGGNSLFTMLLPLLYLIQRRPALTEKILRVIRKCEANSHGLLQLSLQRWVLLGPAHTPAKEGTAIV